MNFLTLLLGSWKSYLAIGLISLGLGAFGTYKIMHNANLAAQTTQAKETVRLVVHDAQINTNLGTVFVPEFIFIATETKDAAKEIPQHVTPEIDRLFPVPLGFVRVWNSRTSGPVPGAAAGRDADTSGVPLSTVADAHNEDVGALKTCLTQNDEWWRWYDDHSVAFNKAHAQ